MQTQAFEVTPRFMTLRSGAALPSKTSLKFIGSQRTKHKEIEVCNSTEIWAPTAIVLVIGAKHLLSSESKDWNRSSSVLFSNEGTVQCQAMGVDEEKNPELPSGPVEYKSNSPELIYLCSMQSHYITNFGRAFRIGGLSERRETDC